MHAIKTVLLIVPAIIVGITVFFLTGGNALYALLAIGLYIFAYLLTAPKIEYYDEQF